MGPRLDFMEFRLNGGDFQSELQKHEEEKEKDAFEAVNHMREQLLERKIRSQAHLEAEVKNLETHAYLASCKARLHDLQITRDEAEKKHAEVHNNSEEIKQELHEKISDVRNLHQRMHDLRQLITSKKAARYGEQAYIYAIGEEGCKKSVGITASKRKVGL
jgi:chromosome segregation ATPase